MIRRNPAGPVRGSPSSSAARTELVTGDAPRHEAGRPRRGHPRALLGPDLAAATAILTSTGCIRLKTG
jgi:hypothetical protein